MAQSKGKPLAEITSHVYTTKDYSLFSRMDGNRELNKLHVNRLKKSMLKSYLYTVIVVNESLEIIDGHHRFEAIKGIGLPLNYIICKGYGLSEVHIFNQNAKTWNADDYMNGYCDLGKTDYLIYREFRKKYQVGHNESMSLLSGRSSMNHTNDFYAGIFKVKAFDSACAIMENINLIGQFYTGNKRRSFVYACSALSKNPNFSFPEFISKLSNQPTALVDCVSVNQYIALIEDIYNYRRREKVNLRY
jgi:hypothetical protein